MHNSIDIRSRNSLHYVLHSSTKPFQFRGRQIAKPARRLLIELSEGIRTSPGLRTTRLLGRSRGRVKPFAWGEHDLYRDQEVMIALLKSKFCYLYSIRCGLWKVCPLFLSIVSIGRCAYSFFVWISYADALCGKKAIGVLLINNKLVIKYVHGKRVWCVSSEGWNYFNVCESEMWNWHIKLLLLPRCFNDVLVVSMWVEKELIFYCQIPENTHRT